MQFIHIFPAQGNGFRGSNFGSQCTGGTFVYKGPGNDSSKNQLQSSCPDMIADLPICKWQYGKKIILSLGGATNTYQLTGGADGLAFADFLWGAFGPKTAAWDNAGKPRPFDGPSGQAIAVDGFDFNIEHPSTGKFFSSIFYTPHSQKPLDNSEGYIALINRLRSLFPSSNYLITGAPQCVVPDTNMGTMISQAKFDILYIRK